MATAAPMPSKPALALQATRAPYTLTSIIPGCAGIAAAIGVDGARWWLAPVAILGLLLVHSGVNLINDVEDYVRGADTIDKLAASGTFTGGLMSVEAGRRFTAALFAGGFAVMVLITAIQGWAVLAIGVAGIAVGLFYSYGPAPLKYVGLGDVTIIPVMGPLITQGVYTSITGDGFAASAFWIGLGPGLLIAAVLGANNLSDIDGDRAAGVKSVAVRFGFGAARALYVTVVTLAFVVPVAVVAAGALDWPALLPVVTLPLGARCVLQARAHDAADASELRTLVPATAQLHMLFSALLVVGIVLARA